eukprot:9930004-Karenia_brevis.AAC.1
MATKQFFEGMATKLSKDGTKDSRGEDFELLVMGAQGSRDKSMATKHAVTDSKDSGGEDVDIS